MSVLITGETGAGKELIARFIHDASPRAEMAFVPVNCSAISPHLLESELFGHERGAFTGAMTAKRGLVEAAHRGTLFLDEVGDLHPDHQTKILRFLQEGKFRRVGSLEDRTVDVRVVAATNRVLEKAVQEGQFRQDLFYRLAVVPLHAPPLRERSSDIPALSKHFLDEFTRKESLPEMRLAPAALALLKKHRWPGNVRELKSVLLEAAVMCDGPSIDVNDLPARVLKEVLPHHEAPDPADVFVNDLVQQMEASPGFLDPAALAEVIRTKGAHALKRSALQTFLQFLIARAGVSFRFKDVVDYFTEKNIGTRESRIKLARQILKECGIVRDNKGKTKQLRMRLDPHYLASPFNEVLPRLDSALGEIKEVSPEARYVIEDFFLENFDTAFSEDLIRSHLGPKALRIMAVLKKKLLLPTHRRLPCTAFALAF